MPWEIKADVVRISSWMELMEKREKLD